MRKLGFALTAAALIATPALAADITVAVTAIVEHPALDAARDGGLSRRSGNGDDHGD
ncbi:MAG: ABC transporter permease, partial [Bauldia sp.]|nr:ABC transporter permease [Bauldia sp.]